MDDILILNESKSGAEKDFELVVSIPEHCGFLINREKSAVEATILDEKVSSIVNLCECGLKTTHVSLRDVAILLGNFAWAIQAIPFVQVHYRSLRTSGIGSPGDFP